MRRLRRAALGVLLCCQPACEASFGNPALLYTLAAVPLFAVFLRQAFVARQAALHRFAAAAMVARLAPRPSARRLLAAGALKVTALCACLLALALPRWGSALQAIRGEGVDIVVAVDVSGSMLVQDVQAQGKLTRLSQAKRDIVDLLRIMDGDRVGLVAFAGAAFVECPLTLDYGAAALFLDDLDTDLIGVKGTALGDGIRSALAAMGGAEHSDQAIILITDGEDHGGDALAAARAAKERNVRIYPIGIGRAEGAPIPLPEGGFHRDAQGNLVLSRLDEATLQQIAQITGGLYTRSVGGAVDLESLYTRGIRAALRGREHSGGKRLRHVERFDLFVALAALALAAEALLPERRLGLKWRRRRDQAAAPTAAAQVPHV